MVRSGHHVDVTAPGVNRYRAPCRGSRAGRPYPHQPTVRADWPWCSPLCEPRYRRSAGLVAWPVLSGSSSPGDRYSTARLLLRWTSRRAASRRCANASGRMRSSTRMPTDLEPGLRIVANPMARVTAELAIAFVAKRSSRSRSPIDKSTSGGSRPAVDKGAARTTRKQQSPATSDEFESSSGPGVERAGSCPADAGLLSLSGCTKRGSGR